MRIRRMLIGLVALTATAIPLTTVAVASAPTPAFAYSGQHCIDSYGPFGISNHVCATVYGAGRDVSQVGYKIDATLSTAWCGYVEVVLAWPGNSRYFYSPHGCSNTGSTQGLPFAGNVNVYMNIYPYNGTVKVYAISDQYRPFYGGYVGFNIT